MDLMILKKVLHSTVNCIVFFREEQEDEAVEFYNRMTQGCFVIIDSKSIPEFKKGTIEVTCFGDYDRTEAGDCLSAIYYVKIDDEDMKNIEDIDEYIDYIMAENLKKLELYDVVIRQHAGILRYRTESCESRASGFHSQYIQNCSGGRNAFTDQIEKNRRPNPR